MKFLSLLLPLIAWICGLANAADPISLENRRELFVDGFLIESLEGAEQNLHQPSPQEVAIIHDERWEGNTSYYHTIFQDGDLYRMYYRGAHAGGGTNRPAHQVVCYAESNDGINWTKPELGLHEFEGSKENNIIWTGIGHHNFAPFKDTNPKCPPEALYKAIGHGKGGLYVFQSADAIHWSLIKDEPVITKGAFDSQNLAFYDNIRGRYVDFHRGFRDGYRAIMTCTSDDFTTWTEPEWVEYEDDRGEHLYTNQTTAYPRAPQIFMSFPKRFLPDRNPVFHRNSGVSDIVFMTSRDGRKFHRWGEAFLRPGLQRERWVNRNNFVGWGIVETASRLDGVADELSFYSMEGYYAGEDCQMRRYTLRPDGFVSVNAPLSGGEILTKPLTFSLPPVGAPYTVEDEFLAPVRSETESPIRGEGSLQFEGPGILTLGDTENLGQEATLGVTVRGVPSGHRRLFSTYNGSTTEPHELYFDCNAAGEISSKDGYSIRFNYNGVLVGAKFEEVGDWSAEADPKAGHRIVATWKDGVVALYFDGKKVGEGGAAGKGDLQFALGDLRFGEDYPGTSLANEPFLGTVDDLFVLRRVLSADEVAALTEVSDEESGIHLDFEESKHLLSDRLSKDGRQTVKGPIGSGKSEVGLLVNFSTSAAGSIRCEIQDENGDPIPGFCLADSDKLYGDSLERALSWNGNRELKDLAGRVIRLRFFLKDADLYALRFGR